MANRVIRHYMEAMDTTFKNAVTEVDKTKTISELSNKDLDKLVSRLNMERNAEQVIMDLRRNAGERWNYEDPPKVDTQTPINQLYHHGISGMRWGVRRFQKEDGTRTAAGKQHVENASEDHIQTQADRKNATHGLSNAELKRVNERMQLEKTYKELTSAEKKRGQSIGKSILNEIAKQSLTEAGKELATGLMKQFLVKPILDAASSGNKK